MRHRIEMFIQQTGPDGEPELYQLNVTLETVNLILRFTDAGHPPPASPAAARAAEAAGLADLAQLMQRMLRAVFHNTPAHVRDYPLNHDQQAKP